MDGYAPAFVAHNLPFIVVSGLSPSEGEKCGHSGVLINSEIPPVDSEDGRSLLRHFTEGDASNVAWNGRQHVGRNKFKIKTVGREYSLPIREAQLPSTTPTSPTSRPVIHSTLSPLSPQSELYPDGLMGSSWIEKHQEHVPSAFVVFYTFTSDPNLASKLDNQLKSDINTIKETWSRSGYKTRLVVALLSEKSVGPSTDIEERLANIRKSTGLDSKTSLFFLPQQSSAVELRAFLETIILTIYPLCIEYYRDLSKHSRRKRNRGIVPPPTVPPTSGTSQTLSLQGWNVRYDFKLGVFAEFRQEMDAAVRSYESGYEGLLGPDVLEAIASWSPRWNEYRLLSDVFAIRILRCLLWNGNSTAAVRRWQSHRERIRDFVDRRGKGSSNYGWEAWEARWATIMAQLIKRVAMTGLVTDSGTMYLPPEKSIAIGERTQPWELLHHPGYWYYAACRHSIARRSLAQTISEEDRVPPSQSTSQTNTYDNYLCPGPHEEYSFDHSKSILGSLSMAAAEYEGRGQSRMVQEIQLLSAKELMREKSWEHALKILRPLWQKMTYRNEGWWNVVEEVGWALRNAAVHAGDGVSVLSVDWELMNKSFTHRPNWHYNLTRSLENLTEARAKPVVVLHDSEVHSFLSATFLFERVEGKVGETSRSQCVITSSALRASSPVTMTSLKIEFEGSMKPIVLQHRAVEEARSTSPNPRTFSEIPLSEATENGRSNQSGDADLSLAPGQTKIYEFQTPLREDGEVKANSATFFMSTDNFDLEYVHALEQTTAADIWWGEKGMQKRIARSDTSTLRVLPKPPKMELRFVGLQSQYYTSEGITLELEVLNAEDVDAITNLEFVLRGEGAPPVQIRASEAATPLADENEETKASNGTALGKIASSSSSVVQILIPPIELPYVYELAVKASYHLISDLETPVSRSHTMQLEVINPFEANYDFSPRIHPDPWPSFFTHDDSIDDEGNEVAHGLAQKWCLTARYASFATEDLFVEDIDVEVIGMNGGIDCSTKRINTLPEGGIRVTPRTLEEAQFDSFTQKMSLDDRGTATLDVSLAIKWRRDVKDAPVNISKLAVPRLLVSSSEPRVLAAVSYSTNISSMIHFDVTIENPSNHFLTFGLTMEPNEKFAFSGVKQSTLQLVPLSRRTIRFRLLPAISGDWIGPINCVIKDRYFQKTLKIAPTEGMKMDKEGILIWVPPDEDEALDV